MKNICLDKYQLQEIEQLKSVLLEHKKQYADFKSFVKTCDDALIIAEALTNNDFNTFKKYKLKYSQHNAEKMKGIQSLSTYKKTSDICRFLSMHTHTNIICEKCYAEKSLSLYKSSLTPALIYNTLLLKYIDLDLSQIPYINDKYFRFEAFSDLQSSKHLKNLFLICKKNKETLFTLWTKAGYTLKNMMDKEQLNKIPNNLNIVISECYINKKTDLQYLKNLQGVINSKNNLKAFCVFDNEDMRQNSNMYLCKNKCIDCLKCYKKSKDIIYIAEKLH